MQASELTLQQLIHSSDQYVIPVFQRTTRGYQPDSVPAYPMIDGHQRLTTLSILLCVVRDVASSHGWNELAAEVDEN